MELYKKFCSSHLPLNNTYKRRAFKNALLLTLLSLAILLFLPGGLLYVLVMGSVKLGERLIGYIEGQLNAN